ncbi:Transcriptional regulatory protein sin3, partial [Ceratobasidium sp. 423]
IIDVRTLVDRACNYLNDELLAQFKEILGGDDWAVEVDNGSGGGGLVAPALDYVMDREKRATFTLDPHLGGKSRGIYKCVIKKVYDKAMGAKVICALHENPVVAVCVMLDRLKQKEEEWKPAQHEWNKVWHKVDAWSYYKSLGHEGANLKVNDKKAVKSKQLVLKAKARHKAGHKACHWMVGPTFRRVGRKGGTLASMLFVVDDMSAVQNMIKLVLVYLG